MNVGQLLELHLGWAAKVLGFQAVTPVFDGATEAEVLGAIQEANEAQSSQKEKHFEETGECPGIFEMKFSLKFHLLEKFNSMMVAQVNHLNNRVQLA